VGWGDAKSLGTCNHNYTTEQDKKKRQFEPNAQDANIELQNLSLNILKETYPNN
jgi:hypothetical protein